MARRVYVRGPLELRLWSKVNGPWADPDVTEDDCWLWQGCRGQSRRPKTLPKNKPYHVYGRIHAPEPGNPKRMIGTHRAALIVTFGDPPAGGLACHDCDSPLCCNPSHLFWSDAKGNVQDALTKGRLAHVAGRFAHSEAA